MRTDEHEVFDLRTCMGQVHLASILTTLIVRNLNSQVHHRTLSVFANHLLRVANIANSCSNLVNWQK